MIISTASLLTEYKLTRLERRVPAKLLTRRFCSKLSLVKCKRFGVLRELPETQPDRTKAGKTDFFLNKRIPV